MPLYLAETQRSNSPLYDTEYSITVMGESAGASSIVHHLTGESGTKVLPFQKAIIQSPAFFPQLFYFYAC
jgi:hypothetical protein